MDEKYSRAPLPPPPPPDTLQGSHNRLLTSCYKNNQNKNAIEVASLKVFDLEGNLGRYSLCQFHVYLYVSGPLFTHIDFSKPMLLLNFSATGEEVVTSFLRLAFFNFLAG